MSEVTLNIEADVNPTEATEKVKKAIENLFAPSLIELVPRQRGSLITAKTAGKGGLERFYALLRQERILTAARRVLTKGLSGKSITFCLNKQAAYVKRISFCESMGESSLGSIRVEIKSDDPKVLIDWLTPRMS